MNKNYSKDGTANVKGDNLQSIRLNRNYSKKMEKEFKQLETKIFIRTAVVGIVAIFFIFNFYSFILEGHFAKTIIAILNFFLKDYNRAMRIYEQVFRNYMDWFLIAGILIVFLVGMRIYLKEFSKYFYEINRGMDMLSDEDAGEIILSPELSAIEKKMNLFKHTLRQQKMRTTLEEQRKNDLIVYLAHDLKTPLTSVIGYLTLLRDENQISEELREKYLSISLEKAERLEDLINEFFEITRFNLSDITLEYSKVNVTRLLEQLVFEFKPIFLEKNLKCELQAAPNILLSCDVDKMQRVFDNLLRNAVNYSFDNSTIFIIVTQEEKNLHVKFINSGNTIPEQKLARIFEKFFRLDTARSSESGGAGLGLAIAKQIVELHKGNITAKSEKETIEFEVILPFS